MSLNGGKTAPQNKCLWGLQESQAALGALHPPKPTGGSSPGLAINFCMCQLPPWAPMSPSVKERIGWIIWGSPALKQLCMCVCAHKHMLMHEYKCLWICVHAWMNMCGLFVLVCEHVWELCIYMCIALLMLCVHTCMLCVCMHAVCAMVIWVHTCNVYACVLPVCVDALIGFSWLQGTETCSSYFSWSLWTCKLQYFQNPLYSWGEEVLYWKGWFCWVSPTLD